MIVGAGCIGASTAFHLAERDLSSMILEKGLIASGPTGRSGAQLIPRSEDQVVTRMKWEGVAFYRHFEERTGSSADFREIDYVAIAAEDHAEALRIDAQHLRNVGSRAISGKAADVLNGATDLRVRPDESALSIPEVGFADPVPRPMAYWREHGGPAPRSTKAHV